MGAAAATRAGTFAAAGSAVAGAGLETEAGTGALGSLAAAGSDAMAGVVGEAGAAAVDSTIAAVDGIGDALLGDAAASKPLRRAESAADNCPPARLSSGVVEAVPASVPEVSVLGVAAAPAEGSG